ncbi:unnamed protein product [Camellia sinensis]
MHIIITYLCFGQWIPHSRILPTKRITTRRPLRAWEEDLHHDLLGRLQQIQRSRDSVEDKLIWTPLSSGIFTVKSLYDLFEISLQVSFFPIMNLWKTVAPPKIKAFGWLVWWDRIATANLLLRHHIIHTPIHCAFCGNVEESTVHLLVHCYYSWRIWSVIVNWWGILWVSPGSIQELLVWWFGQKRQHLGRVIWEALPLAILWTIWIARNDKVFNSKEPNWVDLVETIKIKVAFWVKQSFSLPEFSIHDFLFCLHGIKGYRARISN